MDDRNLIQELMAQVREIADGQIRIEGKLDVMTNDYNNKYEALSKRIDSLEKENEKQEEQKKWLIRTIVGQVIVIAFGMLALYNKTMG